MASSLTIPSFSQRRKSEAIMETAEDLLDKLESLSDLLTEIEEKYSETSSKDDDEDCVLRRFRDGLDSARNLIGVLKREKWRLSKREMSVELRMGELEDYKSHLKKDMSSMNETVEVLSIRVVQLENALCEAQDTQESQEAEIAELRDQLAAQKQRSAELESRKQQVLEERSKSASPKPASASNKRVEALRLEVEVLTEENHRLKEMIRAAEESVKSVLERQSSAPEAQQQDSGSSSCTNSQTCSKSNGAPRQVVGLLCDDVSSLTMEEEKARKAPCSKIPKNFG